MHTTGCVVLWLQTATVVASENGLKVSVEEAKCVLANAFIQAALFQQFIHREEQITFKINLTVLMVRHALLCYSINKLTYILDLSP